MINSATCINRIHGVMVRVAELDRMPCRAAWSRASRRRGKMGLPNTGMPEDGSIHFRSASGQVDMRVSIMPTVYGETR